MSTTALMDAHLVGGSIREHRQMHPTQSGSMYEAVVEDSLQVWTTQRATTTQRTTGDFERRSWSGLTTIYTRPLFHGIYHIKNSGEHHYQPFRDIRILSKNRAKTCAIMNAGCQYLAITGISFSSVFIRYWVTIHKAATVYT